MYDPECVRLSLHYFTTRSEVDLLVDLLQNRDQPGPGLSQNRISHRIGSVP
jgi:hypothetical protein